MFDRHYWQYYGGPEAGGSCNRRWDQWWTCTKESWCWLRHGKQNPLSLFFFVLLGSFWDWSWWTSADVFFTSAVFRLSFQTHCLWLRRWGAPPSGFLWPHNFSAVHYTFLDNTKKRNDNTDAALLATYSFIFICFIAVVLFSHFLLPSQIKLFCSPRATFPLWPNNIMQWFPDCFVMTPQPCA